METIGDYERHTNLAPGQQANPRRDAVTGAVLAGADVTRRRFGPVREGVMAGVISGYANTNNTVGDTTSVSQSVAFLTVPVTRTVNTTNSSQTIDGAFVGVYGSYYRGGFSVDVLGKVDLFDLDQQANVSETIRAVEDCGGGPSAFGGTVTSRIGGSTSLTNYVIATNINQRFDLSSDVWIEPTVGLRYTLSDFGSNAASLSLKDGQSLRLQGGIRIGTGAMGPRGFYWTGSLGALLYSDVIVNGYAVRGAGVPPFGAEVDEGKLRVMGIIRSKWQSADGRSFWGQLSMRGGEDVLGATGQFGVRYEW